MLAYFLKILNKKLSTQKVLVDRQRPYCSSVPTEKGSIQSPISFTGQMLTKSNPTNYLTWRLCFTSKQITNGWYLYLVLYVQRCRV